MNVYEASVLSKGRVTLPMEVRRKLGIAGAGILTFSIRDDGRVFVYAKVKDTETNSDKDTK
jgi:bifunctional DNA-binding transcriptional regulator/antitoxin component of YhaV-PrlF toxin-antitoxin module